MSTNKTQNYNLHSWLPQDEFHVSEINENFTALDAALKAEADARTQQLAAKADAAQLAAVQTALGQKVEVVFGQYAHTNAANMAVSLGRKPAAVLIEHIRGARNLNEPYGILLTEMNPNQYAALTEDGFIIIKPDYLNSWDGPHIYMAFFLE